MIETQEGHVLCVQVDPLCWQGSESWSCWNSGDQHSQDGEGLQRVRFDLGHCPAISLLGDYVY